MRLFSFGLIIAALGLSGCVGAQVRASGQVPRDLANPMVAFVSDDPLSEALNAELMDCGFKIIERTRLASVLDEHKLSFSGLLEKDNGALLGRILNINLLVFVRSVTATHFGDRIQSASVKMVDIKTGQVVVAVNYSNGGGGAAGSPADATMKEKIPESARRIARGLAAKFGKECQRGYW